MKVELTIDANQMGDTLVDLFKNLTQEQKEKIALQVLGDWLKAPIDIEANAYDKEALAYARGKSSWYQGREDKDVRNSSDYQEYMKKNPNTKSVMVKEISSQVIEYHKTKIAEAIKTDPEMTKIMDATLETIKENFPKFVHDAMVAYFLSQMSTITSGLSQALNQSSDAQRLSQEVHKRITGQSY